ncbi:HlyD family secretion protein [Flexibacterium corallicola]|uniref:HlyD family secretion protein n=1 Tax=Flexibacterium corallicola TaxID=3037259 RepID=UPI00286F2FDA|nr:HlyD family secretion protein [Pseudovibrio sp. M1P-2-3]
MKQFSKVQKFALTSSILLIALGAFIWKYYEYISNPWTRDGQVRANVIQIATRVSGPIVALPIKDNQRVTAGDRLFQIDPRTYQASLAKSSADLDRTIDQLKALEREKEAAQASVSQYRSLIEESSSQVKASIATLKNTESNYKRYGQLVEDGYVTQRAFDKAETDYHVALANKEQADANLAQTKAELAEALATLAQVQATLGASGEDNAQLRASKAAVRNAELNMEFTNVTAPVDGYITNLRLRLGSQTVENEPALALVDAASFWIDAYFPETKIRRISIGDKVVATLMAYPDKVIEGQVESIGWGVSQTDGSTGSDLLPNISPTFEWIRLAQRIPVRVKLNKLPKGVLLRVGTSASVLVMSGTAGKNTPLTAPPAPLLLQ